MEFTSECNGFYMYVQWNSLLRAMNHTNQQQTPSKATNQAKIEFHHTIQQQSTSKATNQDKNEFDHTIQQLNNIESHKSSIKSNSKEIGRAHV